mmetsp:Transcript_1199/g.3180  ORF Transcript_1199/g.3180 Transcript_1199/m.3180 type:complete len:107 (-) Transcript_1199:797-1117(-)
MCKCTSSTSNGMTNCTRDEFILHSLAMAEMGGTHCVESMDETTRLNMMSMLIDVPIAPATDYVPLGVASSPRSWHTARHQAEPAPWHLLVLTISAAVALSLRLAQR